VLDQVTAEGEPTDALEDECTTLMKELASGSRKQENEILAAMEDLCLRLMTTKDEIAHHKNLLTRSLSCPLYPLRIIPTLTVTDQRGVPSDEASGSHPN
jgi:hypothetical protein